MHILLIDFISALIISGLMFISYKGRKIFQKTPVLLTEKAQKQKIYPWLSS
jgi:hypothetical protein